MFTFLSSKEGIQTLILLTLALVLQKSEQTLIGPYRFNADLDEFPDFFHLPVINPEKHDQVNSLIPLAVIDKSESGPRPSESSSSGSRDKGKSKIRFLPFVSSKPKIDINQAYLELTHYHNNLVGEKGNVMRKKLESDPHNWAYRNVVQAIAPDHYSRPEAVSLLLEATYQTFRKVLNEQMGYGHFLSWVNQWASAINISARPEQLTLLDVAMKIGFTNLTIRFREEPERNAWAQALLHHINERIENANVSPEVWQGLVSVFPGAREFFLPNLGFSELMIDRKSLFEYVRFDAKLSRARDLIMQDADPSNAIETLQKIALKDRPNNIETKTAAVAMLHHAATRRAFHRYQDGRVIRDTAKLAILAILGDREGLYFDSNKELLRQLGH